jgi:hypothetical protein
MEKQHALKILNSLANGVHPATGEVYAADSPYQHPDTVRALFEAIRSIDGVRPASEERKEPSGTFVHGLKRRNSAWPPASMQANRRLSSRNCTIGRELPSKQGF